MTLIDITVLRPIGDAAMIGQQVVCTGPHGEHISTATILSKRGHESGGVTLTCRIEEVTPYPATAGERN